jgi:hypothetical protein
MAEDFDEEEEDFDEEELKEDEVIPVESKKGRPKQLPRTNNMEEDVRREVKKPQQQNKERYVAFRQQAVEGILDRKTQQPIASDIWEALSMIISKLNRLEEGLL